MLRQLARSAVIRTEGGSVPGHDHGGEGQQQVPAGVQGRGVMIDLRAHFGLGRATKADALEIQWPSGLRQTFRDIAADAFYVVEEGNDQLGVQKFARSARP